MIKITTIAPQYAEGVEQLQKACFPTLDDSELMRAEHLLHHCDLFPEGNFVALDDERVVGLGAGFLINFNFEDTGHTFQEMVTGGTYSRHDPDGDWYYGTDISVHPAYRRRGLARRLYDRRKRLVKDLNRKGIVAGGVLPTYAKYKDTLSVQEYVDKVVAGEIFGRTLSVQLRNGFKVRGLLKDYIQDEAADNWASLIVWENPGYREERKESATRE